MPVRKRSLSSLRRPLAWLFALAFLIWGGFYLAKHPESLEALSKIPTTTLIIIICLALVKLMAMGLFTWINLRALGIKLRFWEWYGLSAMTAMGNYIMAFRGGAAIRGIYLKSKYQFPYSLFLSTVASLYLLTFPTNASLGFVAVIWLYFSSQFFHVGLFLFLLACILGPIAFLLLVQWTPRFSGRWADHINTLVDGWRILTATRSTVIQLALASIFNSAISILMIHFCFQALGIHLPLLKSSILGILYLVSAMIPITPAGLGFAEATLVIVSSILSLDGPHNVLVAGLNRSAMLLVSLTLGPIFTLILSRKSGQSLFVFRPPNPNLEGDKQP